MTRVNSTAPRRARKPRKPEKPHKDFPLFAHANGQWAKKVRGKIHFFGVWAKPDEAINRWVEEKDALLAGKVPRTRPAGCRDTLTLEDLITRFLTTKLLMRDAGELSPYTWNSYADVCNQLLAAFGKDRLVTDIMPEDFEQLRAKWAMTYGPVRLGAEINRARVVFNYAEKNKLIPRGTIEFGEGFKRPSKKVMRLHRADQGKKLFEADELRRLIGAAAQPLKAMLLLGINAGLGNSDISKLRMKALDLEAGWLNYPRPKTGIMRRSPLWPETIQALREWLAERPTPKGDTDPDLVFVTFRGKSWTPNLKSRPLTNEMGKLLRRPCCASCGKVNTAEAEHCECGWKPTAAEPWKSTYRPGLSFYALRHTLETIGGESRDQIAVDAIMGHDDGSMASVYREGISDERLQAVATFIRTWLFPPAEKGPRLKIADEREDAGSKGSAAASA
jgi:integrase